MNDDYDEDGDGYSAMNAPSGEPCGGDDCDDTRDDVHPGAEEICDDVDQDCNGEILDAPGADDDGDLHLDESCGGDDCDDTRDDTYPGAFEICDDIDQNCNGSLEYILTAFPPARISTGSHATGIPALMWNGSEFGVAWEDGREGNIDVFFARIALDGSRMGSEEKLSTSSVDEHNPDIVWTGSEYGVGWDDWFARVSATGSKIASEERIAAEALFPSIIWSGSQFIESWVGEASISLSFISEIGTKIGGDVSVMSATVMALTGPSMLWTGSELGLAWADNRDDSSGEIYFARLTESGEKIGDDIRMTSAPNRSLFTSLAWTGSEYGVAWCDAREGAYEVYFQRISALGSTTGMPLRVTHESLSSFLHPSLEWTGREFIAAWSDDHSGNYEVYATRIAATGTGTGVITAVTNEPATSLSPSSAWTGSEMGIAWVDERVGASGFGEVYFTKLIYCE